MNSSKVHLFVPVVAALLLALLPGSVGAQAQGAWSVVPSPSPGVLNAVDSVSANDVWAVGVNNAQTLTEHWNGTAWSVVPSANAKPASSDRLLGVAAISTADVWAVGEVNTATPPLIEHWNGTSWRLVKAPRQAGFLNAVTAVSTNDVWGVGAFVSGFEQTLIEHWNGSNWSVVASPNATGTVINQLYAVAAVSTNDVWAVGEFTSGSNVESLIEHWDGTSWSIVSNPGPGQLSGIAVVSPTKIWAVGNQLINFTNFQTLIEEWNGTSWTVVASPNPGANSDILHGAAADPSSGQAWAVGEFVDTNGGGTLTEFNP